MKPTPPATAEGFGNLRADINKLTTVYSEFARFFKSLITIEQAINMVKGTAVVGTPKSYDSYRVIPVPVNVRYCARLMAATERKFVWEEKKPDQPCNPSHFRDQFRKTLEGIEGVRVLTPHCCRHTYVSQMQALGVDLATIQSIVGHADVDMTKHYLHVQESIRQEAIERFSKAFNGSETEHHYLDLVKSS